MKKLFLLILNYIFNFIVEVVQEPNIMEKTVESKEIDRIFFILAFTFSSINICNNK